MTHRHERRAFGRIGPGGCRGVTGLRIRPGCRASLLDLSCGGLLLETETRLLPGAAVDVLLSTGSETRVMRSRVARCHVSAIHPTDGPRYRAAVEFDEPLTERGVWQ